MLIAAQFPGFCLLLASGREGAFEMRLCFGGVRLRFTERDFTAHAWCFSLEPAFLGASATVTLPRWFRRRIE
jgi:hypothetical protein